MAGLSNLQSLTVNQEFMGFGLLVGQKTKLDFVLRCRRLTSFIAMRIFPIFWDHL